MGSNAISDTGPLLHLHEIQLSRLLKLYNKIWITSVVKEEYDNYQSKALPKNVHVTSYDKEQCAKIMLLFGLHLGESSALSVTKKEKIFLCDDLDAKKVGVQFGMLPVGTIGILLRAYRNSLIDKHKVIKALRNLYDHSSLFVTKQWINHAIREVQKYKKKA